MKTKILFLIPTLSGGGAERVMLNLLKHMPKDMFDIEVVSIFKGEMPIELGHICYRYMFARKFRGNVHLFKLLSPTHLFRYFVGNPDDYDIIVSYLHSPTMRIAAGAVNHKPKLINWIHNEFRSTTELSRLFRSEKEFERCLKAYDRTVFVAESARQSTIRLIPYLKNTSLTIYNTIESDVIRQRALEQVEDPSFNDDTFNIISVGRFSPAKAFDRLLRITARIAKTGRKVHLHLLGQGQLKDDYEKEIAQLGIEGMVSFPGFVENPYKYVSRADLFVCSSIHEGFSTAVSEALIVGTPVVTTLCSGMEELLGKNGEYGIITENNEDALADAVMKISDNPEFLADMVVKALRRGKMFSQEKTVADAVGLFNEIITQK